MEGESPPPAPAVCSGCLAPPPSSSSHLRWRRRTKSSPPSSSTPTLLSCPVFSVTSIACLVLCCVSLPQAASGVAVDFDNDLDRLMDLDYRSTPTKNQAFPAAAPENDWMQAASGPGVRKFMGIIDSVALAGRLFTKRIPKDAFSGNVARLEMGMKDGYFLPNWLTFDPLTQVISGVPSSIDVGTFEFTVKAFAPKNSRGESPPPAVENFMIEVLPRYLISDYMDRTLARPSLKCNSGEHLVLMSLVVDSNLLTMKAEDRVQLVKRIAGYFTLNTDDIMLIQAPPDTNPLKDGSSLIHGLGDGFKGKIKADRPLWIQWQIGCGGQISQKFSSLFASIQRDSSDGTLSEVIQHPLVGWHVTEFTPTLRILVRRQVMEGSGDGDISTPAHPSGGKAPVDQEEDDEDVYDDEVGTERSVVNFEEGSGGGAVPVDDAGKTTADYPATRPGSHTTGTVILEGTGPPVDEEEEKDLYTPVLFTPLITKGPYTTPQPGPARPTIVLSSYDFDQEDGDLMTPVFIPPDEEHSSSSVIETSPIVPSTSVEVESSPSIIEPSLTTSPVDEFTMLPPLPEVPTDTERPAPEEEEEPPRPPEPPPAPINNPPRVVTRFEKQAFIEGQPFTLRVPSDMFYDDEQGDTRSLRLSLKDKGYKELPWDSWIQLGDKRTEIRGLPLEANIGRWIYQLEAEDEYGASASDSLDIMIRQDPQSRIINHKFSLELAITQKGKHAFNEMTKLSQDLLLVQKLADLYGDPNWESIQVLNISQDPFSNVVTFSWRNFTLPSRTCPDRLLRELANILVDTNRGELSFATKESFRPEFNAKDARLEYAHACANYDPPIRPEPVTPPTKTNYAPIVNSAIDKITAHQGELLRYVVPEDTFYDTEDGDTRNMLLSLRVTDTDTPIPPNNWLQFDIKNQEFYGIPLKGDLGKREYTLMCADRDGEHARDALVVYVEHRPMFEHFNVEFTVEFEGDYTTFINSTRDKTRIVEKIADQFGDRTPEHVVVMDVRSGDRLSNGNTVVVAWRNKTIPKRPCPSKLIKELRTKVLDEHGMVSASLVDRFAPDFIVTHAEMIPLEDCLGQLTPTKELPPNRGGLPPDSTPSSSTGAEEFLATFLVPTVVVIALILAAAILACLLYRRNRKGSLTVRNSSYHKGVAPVIMAEELDDMKIEPTKEPVILRNDSASIPPPSYRNPSGHSTPAERTPLRDLSGPYHPPPPFAVDNRGSMGRPKPNSTFRKPPPYVPP